MILSMNLQSTQNFPADDPTPHPEDSNFQIEPPPLKKRVEKMNQNSEMKEIKEYLKHLEWLLLE